MSKDKATPARPTVASLYKSAPGKTALLTYERAVNDNIPARQLHETAEWQRSHERGREQRAHLRGLASELEEKRGW